MTLRILTPEDLDSKGVTALIWGREGVGKSSLAAEMDAPLYINVENKIPPMIRTRVEANGGRFATIDEFDDLVKMYNDLLEGKPLIDDFTPRSLVIDSITDLTDQNVDSLEGSPKMRAKDGDRDTYKVYRTNMKDVLNLMRMFKNLGLPVLITALEQYHADEIGAKQHMPAVPGKLATSGRLPATLDISARYTGPSKDSSYHIIHCQGGSTFGAKAPQGVPKRIEVKNPSPETLQSALKDLGLRR